MPVPPNPCPRIHQGRHRRRTPPPLENPGVMTASRIVDAAVAVLAFFGLGLTIGVRARGSTATNGPATENPGSLGAVVPSAVPFPGWDEGENGAVVRPAVPGRGSAPVPVPGPDTPSHGS
jgi:hypothetical protein